MSLGHTIGIVLGTLAVGIAAYIAAIMGFSPMLITEYNDLFAVIIGFGAGFGAASMYLLHTYPNGVPPIAQSPSSPPA